MESGRITYEILASIFRTLDDIRWPLFAQYINGEDHK